MSSKLEDFLPYYIGQKFTYGGLHAVLYTIHGIMPYKALHKNPADEFRLICTDADGQWDEMPMDDHFKLCLRSLADMTEEERKHIWLLLVKRPFPKGGNTVWFEETSRLAKRCCMMSGVDRVGIEMSGHVWWDCDLNVQKYNPHIITHYLLQQGFDLWDLIPSGLAVDLKTIQQ